ncbi:MAG TPA: hypothetical protein VI488_03710 [Candidatus Angelobacter sp.]
MADTSSLIGSLSTFAALMAGISIAVERVVEIIKGAVPPLSNTWPKYDNVRAGILQLMAAATGAIIASQMPDQIKNSMPSGLGGQLSWQVYVVLGLMVSGGSGAWNHVLDILAAVKTKQAALASQSSMGFAPTASAAAPMAAAAAAAAGPAPQGAGRGQP